MKLVNTEKSAFRMFETFHDRPHKRQHKFSFGWPKTMQEIGRAEAQMYRSNKWKSNPKEFEDYKHIAEGPQYCYAVPGFLLDYQTSEPLKVYGPKISLDDQMPEHVTILAPLIGVQVQLYDSRGRLPAEDKNLFEVVVPKGMLAGSRFPDTDEAFLVVYTREEGVHMIIVGDKLDIEKDGIVG